ncbi:MAG: CHASE2 domain-containing protein, partial [Methylococcales bacterium]
MLAATAFASVLALVYFGGVFQNLELMVYDRMLQNRPAVHHTPPITLITLSDNDLARLQHCSIPDAALSGLLDNLVKHHPRAIGVDLYRDIPLAPGTDQLAAILNQHAEIILAQQYGDNNTEGIPPPSYLNNPDRAGCTDFPEDSDKHIRRALIYLGDNSVCYTFGYLLALRYLAPEGITALGEAENPNSLRLGKSWLPYLLPNDGGYRNMDNRGYSILLDFQLSPGAFRSYSLSDALDNRLATADITNKVVLIGSVSKSGKDFLSIPDLSENSTGQKTAGIKVHGLFVDQLIRAALNGHQPLHTISEGLEWLWVGVWCAAGVLIGSRKQPLPLFVLFQTLGLG